MNHRVRWRPLVGPKHIAHTTPERYLAQVNQLPVVDQHGNALRSFEVLPEDQLVRLDPSTPLPLSLVVLWCAGRCLMVFDRWKQEWELPGGQIEEGESPREAAWRELHEETGQRPDVLTFAGVVTFALGSEQRQEHAAVYTGTLRSEGDFVVNQEIERIIWWDPDGAPVEGLSTSLDAEIARRTRQTG